jgi:hypothetical protein
MPAGPETDEDAEVIQEVIDAIGEARRSLARARSAFRRVPKAISS